MSRRIIYASTLMTADNRLISFSEVDDAIALAIGAALNEFDPDINYDQDDTVYYDGFFYKASVNISASVTTPDLNTNWRPNLAFSYTSTASAATTTTLTFRASIIQRISGTTTHTFTLPVTSTLRLGHRYFFINDSTGAVTINSSGGNLVATLQAGERCYVDCILLTGTTAASWTPTVIGLALNGQNLGDTIQASTNKATPIDADRIGYWDSVADTLKHALWSDIKTTLKTYNDTLYDVIKSYQTIATAAGTTTLTATSPSETFFTGSTTQNCDMPVASTLYTGWQRRIVNNSSGLVTIRSSGGNTIGIMGASTEAKLICILASGTSAASWHIIYKGINVTSGKVASITNNLTFVGTDGVTSTFPSSNHSVARIDAAQAFSGTQTFNNYIQLSENGGILMHQTLSADGKFSIIAGEIGVLGESLAVSALVYRKGADSRWWKADSDSEATSGPVKLGIVCVAGNAGDECQIMLIGKIRGDALFPALTVDAPVYIGSSAGTIQATAPTSGFVRVVGYADTADSIYFNPDSYYEERGTWTPVLTFGGGSTGITYAVQTGYFNKSYRKILSNSTIVLTNKGSSTGQALVTGHPFASPSGSTYNTSYSVSELSGITFSGFFHAVFSGGNSFVTLKETTLAGVISTIDETDFTNSSVIVLSGHTYV